MAMLNNQMNKKWDLLVASNDKIKIFEMVFIGH